MERTDLRIVFVCFVDGNKSRESVASSTYLDSNFNCACFSPFIVVKVSVGIRK